VMLKGRRGGWSASTKLQTCTTLSTTNSTWTSLGSNPGLCGDSLGIYCDEKSQWNSGCSHAMPNLKSAAVRKVRRRNLHAIVPCKKLFTELYSESGVFSEWLMQKMKVLWFFRTSEITHTVTHSHIPEDLDLWQEIIIFWSEVPDNFTKVWNELEVLMCRYAVE
jgi:hypothetical protein